MRLLSRSWSLRTVTAIALGLGPLPQVWAEQKIVLKPFTSDGCSVFPDGTWTQNNLWLQCCLKHDYDYWKGGSEDERQASDQALKQCVIDLGEPEIAELMLAGVRAGGGPYWPTSYRWGYGWPLGRGYQPLTDDEKKQVDTLSKDILWLHASESTPISIKQQ